MRLIPPHSERETHIANIQSDEVIQTPCFFGWCSCTFRQLGGFLANGVIENHPLTLQARIPLRHLLPIGERGDLYVGTGVVLVIAICVFVAIWPEVFYHPRVNPSIAIFLDFRLADRKSTRLNSSHLVISYAV